MAVKRLIQKAIKTGIVCDLATDVASEPTPTATAKQLRFNGTSYGTFIDWNPTGDNWSVEVTVRRDVQSAIHALTGSDGDWYNYIAFLDDNTLVAKVSQYNLFSVAEDGSSGFITVKFEHTDKSRFFINEVYQGFNNQHLSQTPNFEVVGANGPNPVTNLFEGVIKDLKFTDNDTPSNSRHYPMTSQGTNTQPDILGDGSTDMTLVNVNHGTDWESI